MYGPSAWVMYTRAVAAVAASNAKKRQSLCVTCGEPAEHVDHMLDKRDGEPEFTVTRGHQFRTKES